MHHDETFFKSNHKIDNVLKIFKMFYSINLLINIIKLFAYILGKRWIYMSFKLKFYQITEKSYCNRFNLSVIGKKIHEI